MRGIKPPRPHVFEPLFVKLLQLGVAFHPISSYETHPMTELPSRPIAPSKFCLLLVLSCCALAGFAPPLPSFVRGATQRHALSALPVSVLCCLLCAQCS